MTLRPERPFMVHCSSWAGMKAQLQRPTHCFVQRPRALPGRALPQRTRLRPALVLASRPSPTKSPGRPRPFLPQCSRFPARAGARARFLHRRRRPSTPPSHTRASASWAWPPSPSRSRTRRLPSAVVGPSPPPRRITELPLCPGLLPYPSSAAPIRTAVACVTAAVTAREQHATSSSRTTDRSFGARALGC